MAETLIVVLVVFLAGVWGATRIAGRLRAGAAGSRAGSSCGGCSCADPGGCGLPQRSSRLVVRESGDHDSHCFGGKEAPQK